MSGSAHLARELQLNPDINLSIIIPAYNEQDRIVPTLNNTLSFLETKPYASQVIVVSDGSSDNTAQVVQAFTSPANVRLEAMEYHPNRGKGYAVRYGMQRGQGRVIMFMDADYAVPIEYCDQGLALIDSGHDMAIASRAISGATIQAHQNVFRHLSAKIYTLVQNCYLGIGYPDTQCGFKLFTKDAARALFGRQKLDSVIFDPEILWLAKRQGYLVAQFPVAWTHIDNSRIQYDSMGKFLFVFKELFRIKGLHAE